MALKQSKKILGAVSASACLAVASHAYAGGFQLFESSAAALGNAYAGSGVMKKASEEYYNPAAMVLLNHPTMSAGVTAIGVDMHGRANSATNTFVVNPNPPIIQPVNHGGKRLRPGGWDFVPTFHFVLPFVIDQHKAALGFGINSPFGLRTDYSNDSLVRYLATNSSLQVINVGPSFGLQVIKHFSIGGGVALQYMQAKLNQQVPLSDTEFKNDLSGYAFVWGVGGLLTFGTDNSTRIGLSYHSAARHHLTGSASVRNISDQLVTGKARSSITLPDYADLSFYQAFGPHWAMLASLDYTHWHRIQDLTASYAGDITQPVASGGGGISMVSIPLDFVSTWRPSLAVNYKPNQKWVWRLGTAYDESPVTGTNTRTFRLPDADRIWTAFGFGYNINPEWTLDAGYAHLFVFHAGVNETQVINVIDTTSPFQNLIVTSQGSGSFNSSVNEIGVQLTWHMLGNPFHQPLFTHEGRPIFAKLDKAENA